jgi:hypothetical protein
MNRFKVFFQKIGEALHVLAVGVDDLAPVAEIVETAAGAGEAAAVTAVVAETASQIAAKTDAS